MARLDDLKITIFGFIITLGAGFYSLFSNSGAHRIVRSANDIASIRTIEVLRANELTSASDSSSKGNIYDSTSNELKLILDESAASNDFVIHEGDPQSIFYIDPKLIRSAKDHLRSSDEIESFQARLWMRRKAIFSGVLPNRLNYLLLFSIAPPKSLSEIQETLQRMPASLENASPQCLKEIEIQKTNQHNDVLFTGLKGRAFVAFRKTGEEIGSCFASKETHSCAVALPILTPGTELALVAQRQISHTQLVENETGIEVSQIETKLDDCTHSR